MSLRYSTNVETLPTAVPFERCAYSVGFHRILFCFFCFFLNAVCVSLPLQKLTTLKPTITRRSSETLIGGLQGRLSCCGVCLLVRDLLSLVPGPSRAFVAKSAQNSRLAVRSPRRILQATNSRRAETRLTGVVTR